MRGDTGPTGLLERGHELAVLRAAVAGAGRGEGGVLVIDGEPGIGKTRLLASVAAAATAAGLSVVRARGIEVEREVAFGVVRQLFEAVVASAAGAEREALLDGPARFGVAVLEAGGSQTGGSSDVDAAGRAMHGIYWLVANIAGRRPLVIVVDDAQWSDVRSLEALGYVGRRLDGLAAAVVVAARAPADDPPALADLVGDPRVVRLRPRPLSRAGTGDLMAALAVDGGSAETGAVERVHRLTGGNPLLVVELVNAVGADGGQVTVDAVDAVGESPSQSLARTVMQRLGELGADAGGFARAVAVLGDDAELAHVCALAELDRPAGVAVATALVDARILVDRARPGFVHPLVRAAVYGDRSAVERAYLHERAAAVLGAFKVAPARIAAHMLRSEPAGDDAVTACLRTAAADAIGKGDPAGAARYLERALAEPPGEAVVAEVLLELGRAELAGGDAVAAAGHLRRSLDGLSDPNRRIDAALGLSSALTQTGRLVDAIDALERTAAGLDEAGAFRLDVERTSLSLYVTELAAGAVAHMKRWSDLAGDGPTERVALAVAALAHGFDPRASVADAAPLARRALGGGRLIAEQTASAPPFGNACYVLLFAEDLGALDRQIDLAFADARSRGSAFAFLTASIGASMCHLSRGDLAEGVAHADAAVSVWPDLERTHVVERWASAAVCLLVQGLLEWGDVDRARRVAGRWETTGDVDSAEFGLVRVATGLVAAANDDHERALADMLAYGEISRRAAYEDRTTPWRLFAAQAALALERPDQAAALADEAVGIARTWGTPGGLGAALRVRALVAGPAEASERLGEAVGVLDGSLFRLELAKAQYARGVALLRSGRRMDGRSALRRALDGAVRCGATPLAGRAHAELKIAGARPRRLRFTGVGSLTASELRIARMAAAEMTNRTIAQDLFVTPKTVESHLSSIYRKLGINSRDRLAGLLVDSADDEPGGIEPSVAV